MPWDHAAGGLIAEEAGAGVGGAHRGVAGGTWSLAAPAPAYPDFLALVGPAGSPRTAGRPGPGRRA